MRIAREINVSFLVSYTDLNSTPDRCIWCPLSSLQACPQGSVTAVEALVQGRLSKKEAMRSEVQSETMKECTFKPQTNEGKKKHVLEQILAADAALLPSSRYSGTA